MVSRMEKENPTFFQIRLNFKNHFWPSQSWHLWQKITTVIFAPFSQFCESTLAVLFCKITVISCFLATKGTRHGGYTSVMFNLHFEQTER